MLNDPQAFLSYFEGIHRRTVRDIQALPAGRVVGAAGGRGRERVEHRPDRASHLRVADVFCPGLPQ